MMIYIQLILLFLFIGLISFGGGYAMLPLLQSLLVGSWITSEQFDTILAISQATPGAFATNVATYIGLIIAPHPLLGAILITSALTLPGFAIGVGMGYLLEKKGQHPFMEEMMRFLRPTTAALIMIAGLNLIKKELWQGGSLLSLPLLIPTLLFTLSLLIIARKWLDYVPLIFGMATLGFAISYFNT
jgi:chromate transporter